MAELLIRLKDNTHSDAVKDRMCYKRGDVVVVMPDGHEWGRAEGLPDFAVIRTDRTEAQMEAFIAPHEVEKTETLELSLVEWTKMKARSDYGPFISFPAEGAKKIQRVRRKRITTISLTGQVLHSHTRRKWGVVLGMLPVRKAKALITTGRAVIPFMQL
ncbi:MAG: hypothetical protein ACE5DR_06665, partial [Thermodesulfobacteriota bacterium]